MAMTSVSDQPLTWRQGKTFAFIRDFAAEHGYAPSIREIGQAAGLSSTSSVAWVLAALERKGYVHREPGRKGGLTVLPGHAVMVQVRRDDLAALLRAAEGTLGGESFTVHARLARAVGGL
jgi:repressor LexA